MNSRGEKYVLYDAYQHYGYRENKTTGPVTTGNSTIRGDTPIVCVDKMGCKGEKTTVTACYDSRGNGNGTTAPTITGDHQNRITDYTAIVVFENVVEVNDVSVNRQWAIAPDCDEPNVQHVGLHARQASRIRGWNDE